MLAWYRNRIKLFAINWDFLLYTYKKKLPSNRLLTFIFLALNPICWMCNTLLRINFLVCKSLKVCLLQTKKVFAVSTEISSMIWWHYLINLKYWQNAFYRLMSPKYKLVYNVIKSWHRPNELTKFTLDFRTISKTIILRVEDFLKHSH